MATFNREDSKTVLPQLEKINEPQKINVRIDSSVGEIKLKRAFRTGRTIQLTFTVTNASAVAGGSNIAEGRLLSHVPIYQVYGVGYIGTRSIVCGIASNGRIVVRNASSTSLTANAEAWVSIMYIEKG